MIKFFAETYIRLKKKFKSAFTVIWDVESGMELIFLVVYIYVDVNEVAFFMGGICYSTESFAKSADKLI